MKPSENTMSSFFENSKKTPFKIKPPAKAEILRKLSKILTDYFILDLYAYLAGFSIPDSKKLIKMKPRE